jgi:hypothetical protein
MKILDNTALNYVMKNRLELDGDYVITPDVKDEYEAGHDTPLPAAIRLVTELGQFDEATYLNHYQAMLNSYKKRSFYNMRGFGDVSILALLHATKESSSGRLPTMIEGVTVVTSDDKLTAYIRAEFSDEENEFDQKLSIEEEDQHFFS